MWEFKIFCFRIRIMKIKTPFEVKCREIVCAILGHSRICNYCFGEISCARCGDVLQDGLSGLDTRGLVFTGHNCPQCRENFKKLKFRDRLLCPNPFKE